MSANHNNTSNNLLALLSADDFSRLADDLEPVDLPRNFAISSSGHISGHTYFLNSGLGSVVVETASGEKSVVGVFGWEGMAPPVALLGDTTASFAISMQTSGEGMRISNIKLAVASDDIILLRRILLRYLQTTLMQASSTALVNASYDINRRLARWLLMCHDRLPGDMIAFTHEAMARLLGIRRQSITTSLHFLEGRQLIAASRASVIIRNRKALEVFAGDAYGMPEREYDKLLGDIRRK